MFARGLALVGGLVGLAVLVAGCGGSKAPSVASITTTSAPAGKTAVPGVSKSAPSKRPSPQALVACLGDHGLSAVVGSGANAPNGAVSLAGVIVTGAEPGTPRFQAALQACSKYMPGGGPPAMSPTQKAEWEAAMTRFATCMRKNGVPSFPDPTGEGTFPPGFLKHLDPTTTQFQGALTACRSLEPSFGPRIG